MIAYGRSRVEALTREIYVCSLSRSFGNDWMDNLRPGGALRWKVEDRQLGRSGSVLWQVSTSKVVAHVCIG
jgi:hypothetical protein